MKNNITSIQVFGSGCPTCKKLYELTEKAVKELNLEITVEYITDIEKMIELGVMSSPVLVINNKVVLTGNLPSVEEIKELLNK
ncbi:MAG: thioredoxin family protein [Patescibacteria group bacterium]|nr:thioredoxin family protein [Patescibacteria group bacterium]